MAQKTIPGDFHALYDHGFRSLRGIAVAAAPRPEGRARLAARVPDAVVEYDSATQLPNRIATGDAAVRLSMRSVEDPETAAYGFIKDHAELWGLDAQDLATIGTVSVSRRGLKAVNLIQRVEGKEVFNSDVTAALTSSNDVVSLAGQFFPGAAAASAQARNAAATPVEAAIARAASDLTGQAFADADFKLQGTKDPYRLYDVTAAAGGVTVSFDRPVRVKDVMFPLGSGVFVPAYYMELWVASLPAFAYVIDAEGDPDVLYRRNLSSRSAFRYRVFNTGDALFRPEDGPAPGTPHPTGVPDGFQATPIASRMVQLECLPGCDPWLPDGATTTMGNNCVAYADLSAPNGLDASDVLGKASGPGVFDYDYDHHAPASQATNLQNSLVGMFFHVNWLHDRWYAAGFDEASGNAQQDNQGRGGLDGDPILAEGHDFSGHDNANMDTPADGSSPRMQMYEFKGVAPLPSRTSNHEALITFHEMGHYITNRLVGNAGGLTNVQGHAMGEGWGDFFAICMTSQAGDDFQKGVFAVGGWTDLTSTFKNNYYYSIRRYPYSADMSKSPLTFKHISDAVVLPATPPRGPLGTGSNSEVHNAGEVWCAALWEVFVNLVAQHGHELSEKKMLEYVIGGLKVTPLRPTFTQARDGILVAVGSLDAADLPHVRLGFAKRGMGVGAVSPPSSSTTLAGVREDFTWP